MIPEPQRTYVLELFKALGAAADGFVVAGAQAMKFMLSHARATKDSNVQGRVALNHLRRLHTM